MNTFSITRQFKGWATKPEITNMNPEYLGPGSQNMLVDFSNRLVSRAGMELYGDAGADTTGPVRSSIEWDTSVSRQTSIRTHYDHDVGGVIDFSHEDTYYTLKTGLSGVDIEFAEWWDATERITRLIFVLGDKKIYNWGGGVAKVQSNTANTITLQGVLSAKTTIAFNAGVAGVTPATITDSANGFVDAGFAEGDSITVSGSAGNSRIFTIGTVDAGTITLVMADILTTEAAGPAITLTNGITMWSAAGAGFLSSDANRKIVVSGVEYSYSGGESTDTLTGLAGLPAIPVGTIVFQAVQSDANPGDIDSFFTNDFIGVEDNQIWLGSKLSRCIYISQNTNFKNYTVPASRAPGDPAFVRLDNYTTKIITLDNMEGSASNSNLSAAIVCGGTSDFVKLEFRMTTDNTKEIVKGRKLKASNLSGIIGRGAICNTHAGTVYISHEPVMDILETTEQRDHLPLSDIIKPNFDAYDFTDVHLTYASRAVIVALPREGVVLIYDLIRKLWHPPQYFTMPISRIGVLRDGTIIGHSAIKAETYKLFVGLNDLETSINCIAEFPYNNNGEIAIEKEFNRYWTDGYITGNGELGIQWKHGFGGMRGTFDKTFLGSLENENVLQQPGGEGLGQEPLGFNPFGGAPLEAQVNLLRFAAIHKVPRRRAIEFKVRYSMNVLDAQFVLVGHGPEHVDTYAGSSMAGMIID